MVTVTIFVSRLLGYIAAVFLAAMVLLTVADVVLRSVFSYPIRGMLELIELGLACTIFIALPAVFLRDEHLVVDVLKKSRFFDRAGAVVSLVVLAFMGWMMLPNARNMIEFGDVTSDLSIPRLWYWVPVLFGVLASALAVLFQFLRRR
jgi:TRAP-type C4-dicarboxylate transport system permease small subunit